MTKSRLKLILAAILVAVALIGTATVTGRLGRVVELVGTGADPASVFTEVVVPVDPDAITWGEDGDLPRDMEAGTRIAVGEAYLVALALLDGSLQVSDEDLAVHLTGPALASARSDVVGPTVVGRGHHLRVVFYSADGQLVELEDRATRAMAVDRNTALVREEQAVAVLVSIDGVWHLRHRIVESSSVDLVTASTTTTASDLIHQAHVPLNREETP